MYSQLILSLKIVIKIFINVSGEGESGFYHFMWTP